MLCLLARVRLHSLLHQTASDCPQMGSQGWRTSGRFANRPDSYATIDSAQQIGKQNILQVVGLALYGNIGPQ